MSFRITNSMLSSNYLRNMKRNMNNMQALQNQLSSGKQIQKASENPYIASRTMQLSAEMSYNKQYDENIKDTSNWLDTTDTALSQMGSVFSRIQTLLVSAGNGAYGNDERAAIQDEIKEKVNELSQILNTNFDGSYIFGGTKTTSKPTTVVNGVLQYANTDGDTLSNTYLNVAGKVTTDAVSTNTALASNNPIYLDGSGKITTSSTATDGTANTQIIQGSSLYVNTSSGVVSTSSSPATNPLLLKDELYTDLNGNITASKTIDNTLVTTDNELFYLTSDGRVTTSYNPTYTLIPTGTTFYKQSDGKVTTSQTTSSVPPVTNEKIDVATPIYKDEQGYVTTSSITVNNPVTAASVNTLYVSKYTPATGYSQILIDPSTSGNIYTDSRGVLTNANKTDLSMRGATLKNLWTSSYIDSASQQVKTTTPIPSPNNQINLYKDSYGQVTTSPGGYPANEQILSGTNLYRTSDGKVTTISGTGTTPLQLTDTVYVDLNGKLTTSATVNNAAVSVRDTLSIDTTAPSAVARAVIPVPSTDTVIPSDNIKLYIDNSGNITNDGTGTGKTQIVLGDSLYLDSYENITVFPNVQNTLINSNDKLYKDANGNVTKSASNTQVISGTTLYKDATGRVTTLQGGTPPNESIDLNSAVLYKDSNGNITTVASSNGVANTKIDNTINLYKDVNGNITTINNNTQTATDTQLYRASDGSVTAQPVGYSFNEFLSKGTNLYKDASGNLTTTVTGTQVLSISSLYEDASGNITTASSTAGVANTSIPVGTKLYIDPTGQVRTNLIKTGEALYADSNGKIITSKTTANTALTVDKNIYVDATGDLTVSKTTTNQQLTMTDVVNLKKEYDDSSTTAGRKAQIKTILDDKNVAQLSQLASDLTVDISEGINVKYNKTAVDVLNFKDNSGKSINVSDLLSNIIKDLGSGGNINNLTTTDLSDIQSVTANLLQKRSEVGTMQNKMDSAQQNNEAQNYDMTDILSKTDDVDFADATMNYSMMQTVYTAALQTSAKILPMTILNYL